MNKKPDSKFYDIFISEKNGMCFIRGSAASVPSPKSMSHVSPEMALCHMCAFSGTMSAFLAGWSGWLRTVVGIIHPRVCLLFPMCCGTLAVQCVCTVSPFHFHLCPAFNSPLIIQCCPPYLFQVCTANHLCMTFDGLLFERL